MGPPDAGGERPLGRLQRRRLQDRDPVEAHCKITCRLVGDMDPDALRVKIRKHVEARLKPDCKVVWDNDLEGSKASVMDITRPEFTAARAALSDEWQREAVFCGMGGSIPIAGFFKSILGMESMLMRALPMTTTPSIRRTRNTT